MAQNDIGIDLGTTTIIIAQEGKGVVLNQPSVVAMDTRKKTVLEAGDKALAMVGRTPNYISAIFPLKDGVISDHTMTRELICRFVAYNIKNKIVLSVVICPTTLFPYRTLSDTSAQSLFQILRQSLVWHCPSFFRGHCHQSAYAP